MTTRSPSRPVRRGLVLTVLLLSGCAAPPAASQEYSGRACTEVALVAPGDLAAAQARMPAGFQPLPARIAHPDLPDNASLVIVAVNRCAFTVGTQTDTQTEAFVWLAVQPPQGQRLGENASHMLEVLRLMPPGPLLAALGGALATWTAAEVTGAPADGFTPGAAFDVRALRHDGGGALRLRGTAAQVAGTLHHGAAACCRTFVPTPGGERRLDLVSTDQPIGMAPCAAETSLPALAALLGTRNVDGRCQRAGPYDFRARLG